MAPSGLLSGPKQHVTGPSKCWWASLFLHPSHHAGGWLHFHLLGILPSPVAVLGVDRPCVSLGVQWVCAEEGVPRAPARGHGGEGALAPHVSRG